MDFGPAVYRGSWPGLGRGSWLDSRWVGGTELSQARSVVPPGRWSSSGSKPKCCAETGGDLRSHGRTEGRGVSRVQSCEKCRMM